MVAIKAVLSPYLLKLQPLWLRLQPLMQCSLIALHQFKKNRALQRQLLRNAGFMLAGYLLTCILFYLHSLTLNTAPVLPPALAQQLKQQNVTVAELNEALERLERKKQLSQL